MGVPQVEVDLQSEYAVPGMPKFEVAVLDLQSQHKYFILVLFLA